MSDLRSIILETAQNENIEDVWAQLQKVCLAVCKMDREKNANTTFDRMMKLNELATKVQYIMMAPQLPETPMKEEEGCSL